MSYHSDRLPINSNWIHDLARAEIHPDAEQLLKLGGGHDPQQLVEENTIEFLTELREAFNESIRMFNSYSEAGNQFQEVKIYNIAQTVADFMLYRNQIKLLISNPAHGVIHISFVQHRSSNLMQSQVSADGPQEFVAALGPFRDVYWTFQGEKVTSQQISRFYFTEFVRATRENKRGKPNNQVLVDQIKAFLQEKGLDL